MGLRNVGLASIRFPPCMVLIDSFAVQEIIQNADDAGARVVRFYLDHRQHGRSTLVHPKIARFQGPALLSYNDAQFREEDWDGIQNLQLSNKAENPFKVGKFGIGFNSVYHITGTLIYSMIYWPLVLHACNEE